MKKRHRLRLLGITYNQIESGVYAVILEEVEGKRRMPIIIGYPEAQAIECKLQDIRPPRPLTHDLIKSIIDTFGLKLVCIDIYKLSNGVFAAHLLIEGPDGELHRIDSRSSDAISLAIRTDAPIYTSSEVLEESGFVQTSSDKPATPEEQLRSEFEESSPIDDFDMLEEVINESDGQDPDGENRRMLDFLSNYSDREIEEKIASMAEQEKYEVAARLKYLLNMRNNNNR
ncbi:MAG: bifunctional nuclease family protein [Bacteroides sp.]|nr:bifunctional nuclease family protein [Bacteroides sp.]